MNICYKPCFATPSPALKYRPLSMLMLDCWQREYDKIPYRHFKFEVLNFENRYQRPYDPVQDLSIIIKFIKTRSLISVKLVGIQILPNNNNELLDTFIESLKNLRHIELTMMQLPLEFFELLVCNVEKMKIKELNLQGTFLTDEDISCLRSFLIKSRTIQYLNVSSCDLNQFNFAILADGIYKSSSLMAFNANRLLGKDLSLDSEKIVHTLASLLWQNKLQKIEMEKCEFMAHDMEILAEYLCNASSSLLHLNVAYNKIGPDGAYHLLKAIALSGTLKYLNMNGCGLGSHGAQHIAKYLSSCARLESLLLQFNHMESEDVSMILLTIKKPIKLNELALWGNKYNTRTGSILRRLIESQVLPQDAIDITYTSDDTIPGWRVIPWRN
ncbi:uncharacterized protein LOC106091830 [Stomoxys calcitrans]|uniref:uncharacterized protein LOC106091830 n=1 Tax=Stomoxys calcitrans TaxID=35570 RepID=UPI0027E309C7|nr:uncharacterized protein LOC106091830 [Stomoxys calcitrans]